MTFLPIVERELRVAARRRSTYWSRALAALVASAVCVFMILVAAQGPSREKGKEIFWTVAVIFGFTSLFAGVRYTADSLSEEKREGTLGLLFLTDLKGYDVVLGKLAGTSISAIYGLVAILPVLAIPLLAGGITPGEFWRVVALLINVLFLSLATGVMVSALSRDARRAMTATSLVLVILAGGFPLLAVYLRHELQMPPWVETLYFISPGSAFVTATSSIFDTKPSPYFITMACQQVLAWVFLAIAARGARHSWQDRPESAARLRGRQRLQRWLAGGPERRATFRAHILDLSPCTWLQARHRWKPILVWFALGLITLLWIIAAYKWRSDWLDVGCYIATAYILHVLLKIWLASEASQAFASDRRSGALELILSTPLSVHEILRGQLLALRRQFTAPILAVMAVDILFMLLSSASGSASAETFWVWIYLAGIFTLAADAWTLAWLGLWNGLAARHANRAAGHTVSQVLVLPWFLFLSALFAISLLNLDRAGRDMEYLILALWVGISFLLNAVWFFWARSQLNDRLREIVASRFNAPTPWLVRLGLRRPAATTPPTLP